jgi:hypothetical protein
MKPGICQLKMFTVFFNRILIDSEDRLGYIDLRSAANFNFQQPTANQYINFQYKK